MKLKRINDDTAIMEITRDEWIEFGEQYLGPIPLEFLDELASTTERYEIEMRKSIQDSMEVWNVNNPPEKRNIPPRPESLLHETETK